MVKLLFNMATFKCKNIAKKQAKRQKKTTKLVQNKVKGAKIFLTVKCVTKPTPGVEVESRIRDKGQWDLQYNSCINKRAKGISTTTVIPPNSRFLGHRK